MISFDPETHIYRDTETGLIIENSTSILEKARLSDFSKVNPDVLRRAQEFGKAVHLACHLYDANNLNMSSLSPALEPYLEAWILFEKDTGFKVESSEQIVYSKKWNYAGTYDDVGSWDNMKTLIDIKSGSMIPKTTGLQMSSYMEAYNEERKVADKIKRRVAIQLLGNGTYKMKEYKEKSDFRVFTSCLNVVNWCKINNISITKKEN